MTCLIDIIKDIPQDRVAFISQACRYTYADVVALHYANYQTIQVVSQRCVAIKARARDEFALLVALLDGVASRIVFLPNDIDETLIQRYYQETEVNFEAQLHNGTLQLMPVSASENSTGNTQTQWIIPTSGTTSVPKLVAHTLQSLTRTAKSNVEIGKDYVWGLVFDIYRFSGIQVFLQSILGGSTLLIANAQTNIGESLQFFAENNCNIISATPSFWRKALMTPQSNQLLLKSATLGGEIADDGIINALKVKFANASIRHIYASTEVGVGFSVLDGQAGFPKSYIDGGVNDIQLKINEHGILLIKPNKQSQKYIGRDDMFDADGYVETGDLVEVKDGRVYFLGRDSGAINVGGNKVIPEEVEKVLLTSDWVQSAYVYAKKNPMMGNLVCADIVLKPELTDIQTVKTEILKHCRAQMEGYKVPALIKFVAELDTTQSGKLKRN